MTFKSSVLYLNHINWKGITFLRRKTNTQFKREIKNLVGDEYIFLDKYVNAKTKLKVKHNSCGNIYKVTPSEFFQGNRCPYCSGCMKKTDAQFKEVVKKLVGDEYVFLEAYVNSKTKIKIKHNKCGHIYRVQPNAFLNGNRCPYCNSPKGETIISNILDTLNINYEAQKTFKGLKDDRPLSYDFYIPDQNILIEYQGIQHYQPIGYFGGENTFSKQQRHDMLKATYAKIINTT